MKSLKILCLILSVATLTLTFSACGDSDKEIGGSALNSNESNATNAADPNESPDNKTATPAPAASDAESADETSSAAVSDDDSETQAIKGELQTGESDSLILYVGEETGDYAAYCFKNDSEVGRAILKTCKDKEQCEVRAAVDAEAVCKVPGLEADLSASGYLLKVSSVKSLGRR